MPNIGKLISGFRVFKATTFPRYKDTIEHLIRQGQKPTTMVISCCDIRISPAELLATNPGELYIVNNIGGLVPKYETSGIHGIMSAIEYAVTILEVENIIVLGHAQCEGIKMMMSDEFVAKSSKLSESMKTWLSVASEAREAVKTQLANKSEEVQQDACEHESLIISMRNLMTYPYVKTRMSQDKLNIFAWHFNPRHGDITAYDPDTKFFEEIS
jgi:carbonic anhydrase